MISFYVVYIYRYRYRCTHLFVYDIDQPLADADAAFILSFSIIMLNTDLHSDQIQKKMTMDEFIRNNRGNTYMRHIGYKNRMKISRIKRGFIFLFYFNDEIRH
jgi:hypothetical protein